MADIEEILGTVIPMGKDNAIHLAELAELLGVHSDTAKSLVRKARNESRTPILSSRCGYWLATNDAEKAEFIGMMHKQAASRYKTVANIKSSLADDIAQISLSELSQDISEEAGADEQKNKI